MIIMPTHNLDAHSHWAVELNSNRLPPAQ